VAVNFTLHPDGRRERDRASPLCHSAFGNCAKYLETPPMVPVNAVDCVQSVVRSTPFPPFEGSPREVGLDIRPSW